MLKNTMYTDSSATGGQNKSTRMFSGITKAFGVFIFLLALFRFDSSLRSLIVGTGKQWEGTVSKTIESADVCHNPNSFLHLHGSSSSNNNYIHRMQSAVCQCAMTEWANEAQFNTTATIMTGLWNHPHLQRKIREAAKQSLLSCWAWMFDKYHVEKTVTGLDQYMQTKHLGNTTTTTKLV